MSVMNETYPVGLVVESLMSSACQAVKEARRASLLSEPVFERIDPAQLVRYRHITSYPGSFAGGPSPVGIPRYALC